MKKRRKYKQFCFCLLWKHCCFVLCFVSSNWLYNIARGLDAEPVTTRLVSKSIGCCKKFPGKSALLTEEDVRHWLHELSEELAERLQQDEYENNRKARQIVVSFAQQINKKDVSSSRTIQLGSYEVKRIFEEVFDVIKRFCLKFDGGYHLKYLGLSAGHFENMKNVREITSFFKIGEEKDANDKVKHLDYFFESMQKSVPDVFDENKHEAVPSTSKDTNKQMQLDDDDSISSELFANNKTPQDGTSSFFVNYLNSIKRDETEQSPVERNFNTSKILEEDAQSNCSEENDRITCDECGKKILLTDVTSHNDYHFALKMVKSEADLYRKKTAAPIVKSVKCNNSNKRKQPEQEKTVTLTRFFQNETSNEEDGEVCIDCNKRIRLGEIESHRDYHVAKRLHQEINSTTKATSAPATVNTVKSAATKIKNKKGDLGKTRPLTSFFKPV